MLEFVLDWHVCTVWRTNELQIFEVVSLPNYFFENYRHKYMSKSKPVTLDLNVRYIFLKTKNLSFLLFFKVSKFKCVLLWNIQKNLQ